MDIGWCALGDKVIQRAGADGKNDGEVEEEHGRDSSTITSLRGATQWRRSNLQHSSGDCFVRLRLPRNDVTYQHEYNSPYDTQNPTQRLHERCHEKRGRGPQAHIAHGIG